MQRHMIRWPSLRMACLLRQTEEKEEKEEKEEEEEEEETAECFQEK